MMANTVCTEKELTKEQCGVACGGQVNKNPTPGNPTNVVDPIVNDENYDAIATAIVKRISPPPARSRGVNNNQNIFDVDI